MLPVCPLPSVFSNRYGPTYCCCCTSTEAEYTNCSWCIFGRCAADESPETTWRTGAVAKKPTGTRRGRIRHDTQHGAPVRMGDGRKGARRIRQTRRLQQPWSHRCEHVQTDTMSRRRARGPRTRVVVTMTVLRVTSMLHYSVITEQCWLDTGVGVWWEPDTGRHRTGLFRPQFW